MRPLVQSGIVVLFLVAAAAFGSTGKGAIEGAGAQEASCSGATPTTTKTDAATPTAGTAPAATPGVGTVDAVRIDTGAGTGLLWQGGGRGVLLLHGAAYDAASWNDQAAEVAAEGYTVLALEDISGEAIGAGLTYLLESCRVSGVVVVGASAGGSAALERLSERPTGIAGLVILAATGESSGLGDYPKLFIASEGEGLDDRFREMAEAAAGEHDEVLIVSGDAHAQAMFTTDAGEQVMAAIIEFLNELVWPEE